MSLYVRQLTLSNFRNYGELRLQLDAAPVVLTGHNGSGKTNMLEAISLLVPGRGMCRAGLSEWQNHLNPSPWAVAAVLEAPDGEVRIGTGRDPEEPENERRVVTVDGVRSRGQTQLAARVAMAWITPDLDRVLGEGPSARRKLLDRMAYSFDPAHAGRVNRYEKAMRERLRLLRDGIRDDVWLASLEDSMARTGVAIAAARKYMLRQLQDAMLETQSAFPQALLSLNGVAEEGLDDHPALAVEDALRKALARTREDDRQSGTTSVGPHRTDLIVVHKTHQSRADLCSTGEQKALLIAIILSYVRTLTRARQMKPLLLLDDITAHLDQARRRALFDEILALGLQAWLSGTDPVDFDGLLPHAQHFGVEKGVVTAL